jgi:hypothetical protein
VISPNRARQNLDHDLPLRRSAFAGRREPGWAERTEPTVARRRGGAQKERGGLGWSLTSYPEAEFVRPGLRTSVELHRRISRAPAPKARPASRSRRASSTPATRDAQRAGTGGVACLLASGSPASTAGRAPAPPTGTAASVGRLLSATSNHETGSPKAETAAPSGQSR